MGAWGTAIFSDDEACDVRQEYNVLAAYYDDDEFILCKMKEYFKVKDPLDSMDAVFWYAMAAQQVKYGRVCDEVRKNALECIDRRYTMDGWYVHKDCVKREKVMMKLKEDLLKENIVHRKVSKPKKVKAIWKENDVVAYHLVNIVEDQWRKPSDYWFYGKYILLKIVTVKRNPISHIISDIDYDEWMYCAVYDWIGDEIPDIDIISNLNFHPIRYNNVRKEYDYVSSIYSKVLNPSYRRKHDAVVIGNDMSGKFPPNMKKCSYSADVIEFLLAKMPKFTPDEIGYYNINGMP